jgi:hypothetical protein
MELKAPDEESMIRAAVDHLRGRFESTDKSRVEATVRRHVTEVSARARVKPFVGIIAERRARAELQSASAPRR